ncbi:hypothetical protein Nepgr_024471 [Nepenthes gracilis]|uniref:DEAD-box ATP-dependent RNA helicase 39 n=1 Tax=Nepenthes gracilis TaxID=150966 RepID=A0AAD3T490_NEPGR|nr:hypothetical protein Nepgr_024471 [Nepenthes gracilis]
MDAKRAAWKTVLRLSLCSNLLSLSKSGKPSCSFRQLSDFSATGSTKTPKITERTDPESSKPSVRDSAILEKFKLRRLKGSLEAIPQTKFPKSESPPSNSAAGHSSEVVSSFEELGVRKEVREAVEEMGVFVPSELQCVGIPAILERKNVVLSSSPGTGRTLAYLLPVLQLLITDEVVNDTKPKHPRAVVLCPTEELSNQVFYMAKFISDSVKKKFQLESNDQKLKVPMDLSNALIGMLFGTPSEVLQQIEEGNMMANDVKYLVLDDADTMFACGLSPQIRKIISLFETNLSKTGLAEFQIVMITSAITKMIGEQYTEIFERDCAGKVAALLLEMDQTEAFRLTMSLEALKKKLCEAIDTLRS